MSEAKLAWLKQLWSDVVDVSKFVVSALGFVGAASVCLYSMHIINNTVGDFGKRPAEKKA